MREVLCPTPTSACEFLPVVEWVAGVGDRRPAPLRSDQLAANDNSNRLDHTHQFAILISSFKAKPFKKKKKTTLPKRAISDGRDNVKSRPIYQATS